MTYEELHDLSLVIDSHCDAPTFTMEGKDLNVRSRQGQFDFKRMEEGGVDAVFMAIYTPNGLEPAESVKRALKMISTVNDNVEKSEGEVAMATSVTDILKNKSRGIPSILLGMENADPIMHDLDLLRQFYRMGVRYVTLTHNGNNDVCDSAAAAPHWNGLSDFGKEVVREMNALGMMVDVSHVSDQTFYDVLEVSSKPVIASHSCCRALAESHRNMTDDMIKALAAKGGVIQINFYPPFLSKEYADAYAPLEKKYDEAKAALKAFKARDKEQRKLLKEKVDAALSDIEALKRPDYRRVVDHIDHVVKLVGVRYVGVGSDFDGIDVAPEGLEDVSKFQNITMELKNRGYSDADVSAILGGNFMRVMSEICG